ncbi:MAG: peptide chain release factor N(5)-glutamine methyltransferase [Pseudomonadota bacterium]
MNGPRTRAQAIAEGMAHLSAAAVPGPERDARLLYRWAAGMDGAALAAAINDPAEAEELRRFQGAIAARAARQPVSHILGHRIFWGRQFRVTPNVLDPRPESETLIDTALAEPAGRVLDLGTGSGCLLVTLLLEWPGATGMGVDLSAAALAIAGENAAALGASPRATFRRSDWFEAVDGVFDLIIANPPYLSAADMAEIAPELRHEPAMALSPGGDGLAAYRQIVARAAAHLTPGGRLLVEIGQRNGSDVSALVEAAGLSEIRVVQDMDGRDRVVGCRSATES